MDWKRVISWSLIIVVGTYLVAIASAVTMSRWEIYGDTIEEAVARSRLIRHGAYFIVGAALYWRFAVGAPSKRLLHVLTAYAIVQALDAGVSVLIGASIEQLLDPWAMGRSLLAAIAGFGIATRSSNKPPHATAMNTARER
jgi:hypothetical protein